MKLKEIIKASALQLSLDGVAMYLDGTENSLSQTESEKLEKLIKLCNLTLSELSSTFVPMIKSETVTANNGKVYFAELSDNATRITGVYDGSDRPLKYKLYPEYISVSEDVKRVDYEYLPPVYTLNQEIGYRNGEISPYVLAYGLNAEYSLTEGLFDEAVVWRKRYVDALELAVRPKNSKIKGRCFV